MEKTYLKRIAEWLYSQLSSYYKKIAEIIGKLLKIIGKLLETIIGKLLKIIDERGKKSHKYLKDKSCNHPLCIAIIILIILSILFLYILLMIDMKQILVEPEKIDLKIPAGNSIIEIISLKNGGRNNENISIKPDESIADWVNITPKFFMIDSGDNKNINISFNVPLETPLGEYRGQLKIICENETVADIPVLLVVQPKAQFQAIMDVSGIANKTDYFKLKINIKNVGDSPVYGVEIRINKSNAMGLYIDGDEEEKNISLLPNVTFSTERWLKANETGWQTIQVDITSKNAGSQKLLTKIKVFN